MSSNQSFSLEFNNNLIKVAYTKMEKDLIDIKNLGLIFHNLNFYGTENEEILNNTAEIIKKLIKENNINIKNVSIILPNSLTFSQIVTMPYLNEKELISAIKFQADRFLPLPIEETNIDLEILEEKKDKNQLLTLIVGAPKKIVDKVKELIEKIGLIPESVENEVSACARFFTQFKFANLILDLNFDYSTLYFFDPNNFILKEIYFFKLGYIHFIKEIEINTNLKFDQCQDLLKNYQKSQKNVVDVETIINPLIEEFVLEINRFIVLVSNKYQFKIENILIFNYVVFFPFLTDLFKNKLRNNFKILDFLYKLKSNSIVVANHHNLPFFPAVIGGNLS